MIQIASREVYRNRWMSVREDDIRHPDGVAEIDQARNAVSLIDDAARHDGFEMRQVGFDVERVVVDRHHELDLGGAKRSHMRPSQRRIHVHEQAV